MAERARESGDVIGEKYWRVYEHANDLFENRIGGSDAEWKIELFYNDYSPYSDGSQLRNAPHPADTR